MIRRPEEKAVSRRRSPVADPVCRNCGGEIVGKYCHSCGQHAADHNHSLWQFVQEFLDEFFGVDSKFIRTLWPLVAKPGFLTKEWVAGRRVRYITPLKLYITLSAICFLVISVKSDFDNRGKTTEVPIKVVVADPGHLHEVGLTADADDLDEAGKPDKGHQSESVFERLIEKELTKLGKPGAVGDATRKDFSKQFISRLPTANLILLPIFALLFKLLYIRRSRFYVEHLVFALHYYSFFSIALTIALLSPTAFLTVPVVVWMLAYMPLAMFFNYQQGFLKTMFKCVLFGMVYMFVVSMVLFGMVLYAASQVSIPDQDQQAVTATTRTLPPKPGQNQKSSVPSSPSATPRSSGGTNASKPAKTP